MRPVFVTSSKIWKSQISAGKRIFLCHVDFFHHELASLPRRGKPMGMFRSGQTHHTITSTAGSRHPSQQFPGARLTELCSTRRIAQTLFCAVLRGASWRRACEKETGGAAAWYWVSFAARCLETRQNTSAGVPGFPRTASSAVLLLLRCTETEGPLVCCARSDVLPRRPRAFIGCLTQCHQQRDGRPRLADALTSRRALQYATLI